RFRMSVLTGVVIWLVGVSIVLSFNHWDDLRPLFFIPLYADKSIFGIIEFTVSNIMLPTTAFLIALYVGWVMSHKLLREEIGIKSEGAYIVWRFLARYPAVVGVGCVLVLILV
ncbi:MAG: sodium-dependent transporter, partial [Gammaproteobacteria bacterium]